MQGAAINRPLLGRINESNTNETFGPILVMAAMEYRPEPSVVPSENKVACPTLKFRFLCRFPNVSEVYGSTPPWVMFVQVMEPTSAPTPILKFLLTGNEYFAEPI